MYAFSTAIIMLQPPRSGNPLAPVVTVASEHGPVPVASDAVPTSSAIPS